VERSEEELDISGYRLSEQFGQLSHRRAWRGRRPQSISSALATTRVRPARE
jgi:hypothetical protein